MDDQFIFRLYSPSPNRRQPNSQSSPVRKKETSSPEKFQTPSPNQLGKNLRSLYRQLESTNDKHQALFLKGAISRQKKLKIQAEQKEVKDFQCTFKPRINSSRTILAPFSARQEMWDNNRRNKIQDQKQAKLLKELQDCSFRPKLLKSYRNKTFVELSCHHNCKQILKKQQADRSRSKSPLTKPIKVEQYQKVKKIIHKKLFE